MWIIDPTHPIAQEIASRGYMVSVVRMPLSLAVFGPDKADEVITAYPDIRYWVIGGHSLGGSMAASYARKHTDTVQGLAFWASYPSTSDDLSSSSLKGLSTYGTNDQVLNRNNFNATSGAAPAGNNYAGDSGRQPCPVWQLWPPARRRDGHDFSSRSTETGRRPDRAITAGRGR